MATVFTCRLLNQPISSCSRGVVVPKLRSCLPSGTMAQAVKLDLCTSRPQQRSFTTRIATTSNTEFLVGAGRGSETLTRVLQSKGWATAKGA